MDIEQIADQIEESLRMHPPGLPGSRSAIMDGLRRVRVETLREARKVVLSSTVPATELERRITTTEEQAR